MAFVYFKMISNKCFSSFPIDHIRHKEAICIGEELLSYLFLLLLRHLLQQDSPLLVLAAFVLEPDPDDAR